MRLQWLFKVELPSFSEFVDVLKQLYIHVPTYVSIYMAIYVCKHVHVCLGYVCLCVFVCFTRYSENSVLQETKQPAVRSYNTVLHFWGEVKWS